MSRALTKRGPGRPSKFTRSTRDRYLAAVRRGLPPPACAALAGVSPRTVELWRLTATNDPEGEGAKYLGFFLEVEAARAEVAADLLEVVKDAAGEWDDGNGKTRRGDWRAAAWLLERSHGYTKPTPDAPSVTVHLGGPVAPERRIVGGDVIDAEDVDTDETPKAARVRRLRALLENAIADDSHQAVARLEAQLAEAEDALREEVEKTGGLESLPEEEYAARLRIAAEGMPEAHLRIFAEAWLERHRLDTVPRPPPEGT